MTDKIEQIKSADLLPGAMLREQRVAKGRGVEDVAHELHMNVWQLQALEADEYDRLSSSVFVQGYIKSYSRLLDIDAEPLLKKFRTVRPSEPEWGAHAPLEEAPGRRLQWITLLTGLVAAAVIAVFVVWLNANGYLDSRSSAVTAVEELSVSPPSGTWSVMETPPAPAPQEEALSLPAPAPEQAGEPQVNPASDLAITNTPSLDSAVAEASADTPAPAAVVEKTATVTPVPVIKTPTIEPPSSTEPAAAPVMKAPEMSDSGSGPDSVEISFTDESWIELKDVNDRLLVHGLRSAGSVARVRGQGPFQVFLGNGAGVSVQLNGAPFDVAPYVRDNRTARFLLVKPE